MNKYNPETVITNLRNLAKALDKEPVSQCRKSVCNMAISALEQATKDIENLKAEVECDEGRVCDLMDSLSEADKICTKHEQDKAEMVDHLNFLVNDTKVAFTWDETKRLITKHSAPGSE